MFSNFTNPPFWGNKTIWDLDPHRPSNNGLLNEALIVWMRVAAFPDFWKLYGRVDHTKTNLLASKIPKGQYYLKINYSKLFNFLAILIKAIFKLHLTFNCKMVLFYQTILFRPLQDASPLYWQTPTKLWAGDRTCS